MKALQKQQAIYNVMVWESEVDVREGGIRPVSFWDQFLVKDYHARFGYARLDPGKVWDAYQAQSAERGYEEIPHRNENGGWRSVLSREEYAELLSIPRARAPELLARLHRRALTLIQGLMTHVGIAYGYGLADTLTRLVCTTTIWHGSTRSADWCI